MHFSIFVALTALASSVHATLHNCYCVDYSTYSGNYCVNSKTVAASAEYFQHYVESGLATWGKAGTSGGCTYIPVSSVSYFITSCKDRGAVTADCL